MMFENVNRRKQVSHNSAKTKHPQHPESADNTLSFNTKQLGGDLGEKNLPKLAHFSLFWVEGEVENVWNIHNYSET